MSRAPRVTIVLGSEVEAALDRLARGRQSSRSSAVREAVIFMDRLEAGVRETNARLERIETLLQSGRGQVAGPASPVSEDRSDAVTATIEAVASWMKDDG